MFLPVLLVLAVAPGIFWLWYFLARDRVKPEPRRLVARVFFLGAGAAIASGLIEYFFFRSTGIRLDGSRLPHLLAGAAAVGLIEEGAKFLSVYAGIYRHAEFDETIDGIVDAVAAGMGFATLENLQYVLTGGAAVGIVRMLTALPGHAFFGALMGYYLGIAKRSGRKETAYLLTGLGAAVVAHAAWDALAFSRSIYSLALIPGVFILWRRAVAFSLRAQEEDGRLGRRRVSVEQVPAIPPPESEG